MEEKIPDQDIDQKLEPPKEKTQEEIEREEILRKRLEELRKRDPFIYK